MIDAYLAGLKATGKLKIEKKPVQSKLNETSRRKAINHTKAVFALAADYNEDVGLLAIALIDKEIKVYYVK
jgi:hypothetical protein